MSAIFPNQDCFAKVRQQQNLPKYKTELFDFYRCVEFKKEFYYKTVSELFNGNLRTIEKGRYACIFGNQKLSYWADSPDTARAEIKSHGSSNNILTFFAYDDATSSFPTTRNKENLIIVDERKYGCQSMIDKINDGSQLTDKETEYRKKLFSYDIDCLAYDSHAKRGGVNFLFTEKGFKKLSLRELCLRFGRKEGGNHNKIACAISSDYSPNLKNYGFYFAPKAKVKRDEHYLESEEYQYRC